MSGTVCLDVFEQMGVENAKQVGWMLGWLTLLAYNVLGDSRPHPGSFLNSACYRFADFIFAISVRALENEFLSGTDVSMSYNYR